jgi:hypothetical protein
MAAILFFSYSHKDEDLRERLAVHLSMLKHQGLIDMWHDRRIVAGQPVDTTISANLEGADIILLLVSADFLASDYCYDIEVQRALELQSREQAIVIPVILKPCDWRSTQLGQLSALPRDGKPVTTWTNSDEAFLDITEGIKAALRRLTGSRPRSDRPRPPAQTPAVERGSRNLRLPRQFSERDRDDFREDSFNHIANYFEQSLAELERKNPGIESRFRRLDANRFTAVAYRSGKAVSRCTIWMGGSRGSPGGIGYVENDSGEALGTKASRLTRTSSLSI